MNKLLTIFFSIAFLTCKGQETKKITKDIKGTQYKEVYSVLKSDKITRHGTYNKIGFNNTIIESGYYKLGLKDSTWISYNWNGIKKLSEGIYLNNEKTGIWEYYDFKGEIEVRYNYSTNELLFNKKNEFLDTDKEYKVFINNDTLRTILDREPVFIGSMFNELFKNIKYPALARENGKSGKVIVSFVIDKNGKTKNHTIIHGMGYGCDEEALRVIKEYLTFWSPALYQEKPVDIEYILPVTFKLQ